MRTHLPIQLRLSACSSVPSLWSVLLVAFRLGGGWGRAGKMCFSSMKWSGFSLWFIQSNASLWSHIAAPNVGWSWRKSSMLPQRQEPTPTAEAMGQITPNDMCHQPWSRRGWRQAPDSLFRRKKGWRQDVTCGSTLRIKWWAQKSRAGLVLDGCMPQAGANFVLSATPLAFLASVKGSFGTWVSEQQWCSHQIIPQHFRELGKEKTAWLFPCYVTSTYFNAKGSPRRHIFHGLNKISYGLQKRLHSCERVLEHINLGGNNHWSWQEAGVVTSNIHDLWSLAKDESWGM